MSTLLEWLFERLGAAGGLFVVVLVAVLGFVLWLAAPVTWQHGEGSVGDDGENFAQWLRRWFHW